MSVYLYDKAIAELFNQITGDSIMVQPPETAIRNTAQLNGDRMQFPLVSINRTGYGIRFEELNFNALHQGGTVRINENSNITMARIIPIRIDYQVDVFTVDKHMNDEIVRELLFYFALKPTHELHVPYGINIEHKYNLILNEDVVDNSDTVNHVNNGVLFRTTFTMYCPDAYLWAGKDIIIPKLDISLNLNKGYQEISEPLGS
jgi:hypothetical protein